MTVSIRSARQSPADRAWIEDCYAEFLGDLAVDQTGVFPSLAVTGQSVAELVGGWFRDEQCTPFVIFRDAERAGFTLVQRLPGEAGQAHYRLGDFFIRAPYRRLGVGRAAAALLFTRFEGTWTVVEQARNGAAVEFWRGVIHAFTGGRYQERVSHGEVRHSFASTVRRPDPPG